MEWISVNNMMPEADKSVLGFMYNGYVKMVFHEIDGKFLDMWETELKGEVTHWMYLPKSPYAN